ncbi:hypothetical protein CEXT_251851 [Caerostris extrusa]|uniref:Uncharacterized protein n=1 Tax=Caerostris extrusa TaxID=172846 RepID=A0AAV4WCW4_CAEEX|nr:hypothetical protein CEXT_251851 [Caerostris extrusa]
MRYLLIINADQRLQIPIVSKSSDKFKLSENFNAIFKIMKQIFKNLLWFPLFVVAQSTIQTNSEAQKYFFKFTEEL